MTQLTNLLEELVNSFDSKNPLQIFLKVLHLSWKIWQEVSQFARQIDIDQLSDIKTNETYDYKICSNKTNLSEKKKIEIEKDLKWVITSLIYDFLGKDKIWQFKKEIKWIDFLSDEYFKKFAEIKGTTSFSYGLFWKYPDLFEQENSKEIIFDYYRNEFDKIDYKNDCFYYKNENYDLEKTYEDILSNQEYNQEIISKLKEISWEKELPKKFSTLKNKKPEVESILKNWIFQAKFKKHIENEVKKFFKRYSQAQLGYEIYSNLQKLKSYILEIYNSGILYLFRNLIIKKIAENSNNSLTKNKWYKLMKNMIIYGLSENNLEQQKLKDFFETLEKKSQEVNKQKAFRNFEWFYLGIFTFVLALGINNIFFKGEFTNEIIWIALVILVGYVVYLVVSNKKALSWIAGLVMLVFVVSFLISKVNIWNLATAILSTKDEKIIVITWKDRQFIGTEREISSNYYLWNAVNEIYQTYKEKIWLSLNSKQKQKLFNLVIEEYSKKSKINPSNIPNWYKINMQLLENIFLEKLQSL